MNILNIHGYAGSPQNAAYAAILANGYKNIISPVIDYDAESPEDILYRLRYIIADKKIGLIIGTSLGGFFALALSAELNLPVILVNPFLMPFLTFPEYIKSYVSIFGTLSQIDSANVSCIVGENDEVISDYQFTKDLLENSRFRSIPNGKHSGFTLPLKDFFGEILQYYI